MLNKRKIYLRADAGPEIGYGHYIRSLALADMLKQDFDCTMFTQTPTDYQLREAKEVCSVISLPNDDSKFDKFLDYLKGDEIVVLDNYFFTTNYQRAIKAKGCKLVCIDDMHDKHYVADVVINHGCTNASLFDIEPYTHLCLGFEYALLRRPFWQPKKQSRELNSYAICFGGADPQNLTLDYAKRITSEQPFGHIIAIIGDSYQHEDSLREVQGIEVRKRLTANQMAQIFSSAEHVICSASTTAYEALACGAEVTSICYTDNQKELHHLLSSTNFTQSFPKFYNCLRNEFIQLAWRLVNYRELTQSESRQIWQYRNDEEVRQWMKNDNPIAWEEHTAFINTLQSDSTKQYYAFFIGDIFVASYDLVHIANHEAECGLFLNKEYEGIGLASAMQTIMEQEATSLQVNRLYAQVRENNHLSLRFFLRNGFEEYQHSNNYVYLHKSI